MDNPKKVIEHNAARIFSNSIAPALKRIEARMIRIEKTVTRFVPRMAITEKVKERHRETTLYLGNRCPCCSAVYVVDELGAVVHGSEFDHFYSRERRQFHETWLVCKPCHLELTAGKRAEHLDAFRAYQRRAKPLNRGKQVELPLEA